MHSRDTSLGQLSAQLTIAGNLTGESDTSFANFSKTRRPMNTTKYVVAQIGARRSYAVPAILAAAGMLERFYTDICGNLGFGRLLSVMGPAYAPLARLASRRVPTSVAPLTRTFPVQTALHMCRERVGKHEERFRANLNWQCNLGESASRGGFANATHFFSMLGEFPTLVVSAKERGLQVVSEVYILLGTDEILAAERKKFQGWEADPPDYEKIRRCSFSNDVLLTKTNFFICPSEAVRDDLILNRGVPAQSTAIVPYGVNPWLLEQRPTPCRGRVLFAGTADLRKGIHYLAMAAGKLASDNPRLEVRVAGNVSSDVAQQPICRFLNFLGRVPRNKIHEEFQSADLFVLPSLAEGSAEATYEALAAGVPVITTKAAGSVVRDGIEGKIVPERDPVALASAIKELIEDRAMRDRMAIAARERATQFTWERYGERLLSCLRSFPE